MFFLVWDCRDFTAPDQIGSFYEDGAYLDYKIAPAAELYDKKTATVLTGKVVERNLKYVLFFGLFAKILDSHCQGVFGAILDVWYAGKTGSKLFKLVQNF